MFGKTSRYRKLPETVTTDARGRTLKSVPVRPLPVTSGVFLHTLVEGDRLDNLAQKYYRQPAKWWRICDANTEIMSPLALLGHEPLVTVCVPLTCDTGSPPCHALLAKLSAVVGVMDVQMLAEAELVTEGQYHEIGDAIETIEVTATRERWTVQVTFNQLNVDIKQLCEVIKQVTEWETGQPVQFDRVGQQIIIPPDASG